MADADISITLELDFEGDALTGRAIDPQGTAHSFSGWIGLVSVLDELIASPPDPGERDG